jgi:hypothetical protein
LRLTVHSRSCQSPVRIYITVPCLCPFMILFRLHFIAFCSLLSLFSVVSCSFPHFLHPPFLITPFPFSYTLLLLHFCYTLPLLPFLPPLTPFKLSPYPLLLNPTSSLSSLTHSPLRCDDTLWHVIGVHSDRLVSSNVHGNVLGCGLRSDILNNDT